MGTLSKTLASSGGFVAGREEIVTYLRHHARGYIFSGALSTGHAAAAIAALDVIDNEPELVVQLRVNLFYYLKGLLELGFDTGCTVTPIVPVMTRDEATTLDMTRLCREAGLFVVPVVFPAVPSNAPRLRTCISSCMANRNWILPWKCWRRREANQVDQVDQKSALPGVRGKGITSRMLAMPVMNWTARSRPRPKPA